MKRIFLLLILLMLDEQLAAQREPRNARTTIRGNIGIPKPITSGMYRRSFTGVYEMNLSVNMRLFGNIFAGLGYQNSNFQNNKKVFVLYTPPPGSKFEGHEVSYKTRINGHAGFIKIGADKFFSDKGYMSYSLNTGMIQCDYINVVHDSAVENLPFIPTKFNAPFIQPEMSVNFIVEPRLSFCVMLSYTTLFYRFDPRAPRFAHIDAVSGSRNKFNMSWFNLGFGFNILLGKK
jgi:hypothetical protein